MQYLKWDKANIVGLSMGGGIAAAFTSQFPHLVDEGVALIASAGLMEVSAFHSFFLGSGLLILHTLIGSQSNELSRTAKFMSSPLVLTLAASKPIRVSPSALSMCNTFIICLLD
jgi:pimeloyl-ACP methyl ester carboxylesterase